VRPNAGPQLYCTAFFDATGIHIRAEMAKTGGVSPDVMTQLLGKKGLASSAQIELVEKTIERLTKVGGAVHGRAGIS